ncbi:MAG: UDP-N-acetylmuramoyl-L-alanyl-D-glutamate--2,6-diaminopimelate ligase [Anaerolineaceae bacterium]|nr:UDP-N-acetylmuramoyl-L-alanyl-D-glutamate--2,6-diaminopimelate ligase [Anaerolineaceae bacterium]
MNKPSLKLMQCIGILPGIREINGNMPNVTYNDVTYDSRKVKPGSIYVAIPGISTDGHDYISAAVQNGASAVIGCKSIPVLPSVPYIRVEDSREAMAWAVAALYGFPSESMTVIGVTGTDGKTTTSIYLYNILRAAGLHTGMISTVSAMIDNEELDTGFHVTTPESPDIQRYLAMMRDKGVTHVIIESTSHGLVQKRVSAIDFDIAVVTNITHEHLDFHNSRQAYFEAKGMLFQKLGQNQDRKVAPLAVLNYDDPDSFNFLDNLINVRKVAYSANGHIHHASATIREISSTPAGIKAIARFTDLPGGTVETEVRTSLLGNYNGANFLAAMTAAIYGLGIDPTTAAYGIANVIGVPGRMQVINEGQNFTAIVDFAHTPNALEKALIAARKMLSVDTYGNPQGRIIAVYGSAGLRDREKRRMMPDVSSKYADITVLTAEDPRTEPLNKILKEMSDEAVDKGAVLGKSLFIEPDRRNAIRKGLSLANPGDIVLSLGKGHEQSMCFGTTEYLWDDRTAMHAALCEMLGKEGPEMPYLPDVEEYKK